MNIFDIILNLQKICISLWFNNRAQLKYKLLNTQLFSISLWFSQNPLKRALDILEAVTQSVSITYWHDLILIWATLKLLQWSNLTWRLLPLFGGSHACNFSWRFSHFFTFKALFKAPPRPKGSTPQNNTSYAQDLHRKLNITRKCLPAAVQAADPSRSALNKAALLAQEAACSPKHMITCQSTLYVHQAHSLLHLCLLFAHLLRRALPSTSVLGNFGLELSKQRP